MGPASFGRLELKRLHEPYWQSPDGDHTLFCADCMDVLPLLEPGSVDAVVTDPPYGMNANTNSRRFAGGVYGDERYGGGGRGMGRDWPAIIGDDKPFDPSPWLGFPRVVLWGYHHFAERLKVGTVLVWIKRSDDLFGTFLSDCELAWMNNGCGVYAFRKQFPPPLRMIEANDSVAAHPTQKPISLMEWCLDRAGTEAGQLVIDPYCGSGTVAVACIRTGRRSISIEKEEKYCAIAKRRMEEAIGVGTLFDPKAIEAATLFTDAES